MMRTPHYWQAGLEHIRACDPILGPITIEYEEAPLTSKNRPFETLCNAIIGQQISAKAAEAVWLRSGQKVGEWTPDCVQRVSSESLRSSGLSRRKVEYLKGIADLWNDLPHESFESLTDEELRTVLCRLRGIGPWSANMLLIFSYLRPDVFPIKDIGVLRAIETLYGVHRKDLDDIYRIARLWRPYRTVATWYLWRYIDSEPVLY